MNRAVSEVINRMCPLKVGDRVRVVDELAAEAMGAEKVNYGDTGKIISVENDDIYVRLDVIEKEWWPRHWWLTRDSVERLND